MGHSGSITNGLRLCGVSLRRVSIGVTSPLHLLTQPTPRDFAASSTERTHLSLVSGTVRLRHRTRAIIACPLSNSGTISLLEERNMCKSFLVVLVIAAFLPGDRATPQENKKEQSAKPLTGYSVLIVEKFKVEPAAVKAGFLEAQIPVMPAEIILQLVKKGIFDEVVDGSSTPPTQPGAQPPTENVKAKLLLSG